MAMEVQYGSEATPQEAADQMSESVKVASSKAESTQGRRVYVGNLAYSVTSQELQEHMAPAGAISNVELFLSSNGMSKGCGIIEYATAEAARQAIESLNDTELNGRPIFVREDREKEGVEFRKESTRGGKQIFVGNISYATSWQDLKDIFRNVGNIVRADVLMTPDGRSRGQGIVLFETEEDAAKAIEVYDHTEVGGRPIHVHLDKYATSQSSFRGMRGGFRGGRGRRGAPRV
eukprot:Sdes_comp17144_c0_seq1m6312